MSRFRGLRAALVVALVVMTGATAVRAQATVEPTLLEVRLGRVAALALRGERDGDRLWLPVADLAGAVELEIVSRSAARVTIRRWPSRELIVLDHDSAQVRIGARRLPIASGALRMSDGELFADVPTLQAVLRTDLEVSWNDLVIAVPGIDSLPLGRRAAREQARARLMARETQALAVRTAPLARPLADGAVLDYSLSAPLTGAQRSLGWSSALGLDVLGGSLEVSTGSVPGGARLPTLSSWTGVWREGRKLSQLRLGDGLGSGPAPRLGRGIMLTNSPYMRPTLFGLQTLRGDLPPGWTIEAYRNGELVAVDTVGRGSGYQLQLPVLYGENPVDLLAVGPFGQTRALTQNLRIGGDLLARNRSEYGFSMAQCRLRQQCLAAGTLDFRVGLTDRWTMRVGVDAIARDSVGLRQAPYFAFSGTPLPTLAVQLDAAAQSRTRLAVNIEPSRQLRVSMEQSWFSADPIDPLIASRRSAQSSMYANWRSLGASQASIEASLDRSVFLEGGGLTRARLAYGTQTAGLRMQPYVRHDASSRGGFSQSAFGFEATVLPNGSRGRYLGSSLLRVIGEVDPRGTPVRQAMTLSMPLPGQFRVDAGVAVQQGIRGAISTLALSRDLNALRSYTTANFSGGTSNAIQSVQGSALLAPGEKRPQFVTGPSLQRTGVTGIVFLDRNANGRRDPGEPAIPGVQVQVGTGLASSDVDGRYRVWDLMPFDPMPISVDSTTLPSPLWIPVLRHNSIEAGPNRFEPLDIPVVAGGVLEGRVSWLRDGATSLPPIPLLVLNAAGEVIARTATFSDGEFVLFGVRPGVMTVRVDPAWLAAQGLGPVTAQPVTLPATDDGATVRVPVITITTSESVSPAASGERSLSAAPPSVQECAAVAGARCGGRDDDLRHRRSEQRVGLLEAHLEMQNPGAVAVYQRQPQVTTPGLPVSGELASHNAHERPVVAASIHRDASRPVAVDSDLELAPVGGARDRPERERLTYDPGRGDDRPLLTVGIVRREHRTEDHHGSAERTEIAGHETESRQATIRLRAPQPRLSSAPPVVLTLNGKVEVATTTVAASSAMGHRPTPAARPALPQVRWRASLNLPELRAAALSVAVRRPPPDSVPLDSRARSAQLSRSEIAPDPSPRPD